MQDKLGKLKKGKDAEDEIASNDSDDFAANLEPSNPSNAKRNELLDDPFL